MTNAKTDRLILENNLILAGTHLSWEVRIDEERPFEYLEVIGEIYNGATRVVAKTTITKLGWQSLSLDTIVDQVLREVGAQIGLELVGKGKTP